ncbi:MAG: DNA-binding GntR family transcriptional regulator [Yoonia sp.]
MSPASQSVDTVPPQSKLLTGSIEHQLEHLILGGELRPGERLHETQLSTRLGISRGPLREATRSLQAKGLVEVIPNRGVFVRSVSSGEALEIYDVRAAIFGLAGRLLTDIVNDEMLQTMYAFLENMDVSAANNDFDEYYRRNLAFHDFLILGTGNTTLAEQYHTLVNKLHLCRARSLVKAGGLSVSNHEHREMVDAVASGSRERAQGAFFRHVERSKTRFKSTIVENG